jgi:uncharacterized pyridoxal phosphate-dependent enzyme
MLNRKGRREFLRGANGMLAAMGLASQFTAKGATKGHPATHPTPGEAGEDYYDKLGVTKIINAAGTYTALTASTMPPSVRAAVAAAAKHPVRLHDLQTKAGEYLAQKLKCEGAVVSAGASSGLTLGTAACLMVANKCGIRDIPQEVMHMKNEVLIQKGHRYGYDQALVACGAKFVEVETLAEYEKAFTDKTVMAHFFNAAEQGQIGREDWLRVAHQHGVPCFNDAAADMPPIANLWNYTQMGFDLVTFSGGKGIRGPQNAGLLLGKKELIEAAAKNNNPYDGVARGQKVAKEQIVGMVAAVDWLLEQTDESMEKDFRARAERVIVQLKGVPTIETQVIIPPFANHVPHLLVRYDQSRIKVAPKEVVKRLREGTPSIELNPASGSAHGGSAGLPVDVNTLVVGVWMLEPGEDVIVGKKLKEVLTQAI